MASKNSKSGKDKIKDAKEKHPFHKRYARMPIEIRVEVEALTESITTRTRNISAGGISFECGSEIHVGEPMNILLYIPHGKEVELLKVQSEAVWCDEKQGLFTVGSAFRKFAPGDERRLRQWLLENTVSQKSAAASHS
ncbi:MAG: PilZ domain-containing protein [Pseudomonadota bacterium]